MPADTAVAPVPEAVAGVAAMVVALVLKVGSVDNWNVTVAEETLAATKPLSVAEPDVTAVAARSTTTGMAWFVRMKEVCPAPDVLAVTEYWPAIALATAVTESPPSLAMVASAAESEAEAPRPAP